jgi:hypothetical protein
MTSQGTEAGQLNRAFEHALRAGDLHMALATAGDLPFVSLERAARLLHLMAVKQSPLFNKAAARWMARYIGEVGGVTAEQIAEIVNGHRFLPIRGHLFSPLMAMFSPRWWPRISPPSD